MIVCVSVCTSDYNKRMNIVRVCVLTLTMAHMQAYNKLNKYVYKYLFIHKQFLKRIVTAEDR